MELKLSQSNLHIFEAIASDTRIKIIELLAKKKMSLKEIAAELCLSPSITTMHIQKLESASIVKTHRKGRQKICSLLLKDLSILFPDRSYHALNIKEITLPVGYYSNHQIFAPCGLATHKEYIGRRDEPKYFTDPRRMHAQSLWFKKGFVEYQVPNNIQKHNDLQIIEFTAEISSGSSNGEILFSLNDVELGVWKQKKTPTSALGNLTPIWYDEQLSQFGDLKTIRITKQLTTIDGVPFSDLTIKDLPIDEEVWKIKLATVGESGGLCLFGKEFGDEEQDLKLKLYYA